MKKNLLILVMLLGTFQSAYASWDVFGTVDYFEVASEIRIKVGAMNINPGGCGATGEYALAPDTPNYKEIYSALLAARIAGKTVGIDLNGCSTSTYNKVVSIRIED